MFGDVILYLGRYLQIVALNTINQTYKYLSQNQTIVKPVQNHLLWNKLKMLFVV